jgi:very-short-patch-repair endonuclease
VLLLLMSAGKASYGFGRTIEMAKKAKLVGPRNTPRVVASRLRVVAADQLEVLETGDLARVRVHRDAAFRRVRSGEWAKMSAGVYRVASSGRVASIDQRMVAATMAAPGSVIIGWFAAHIYGLPVLADLSLRPVTVAVPFGRRSTVVNARRSAGPLPSRPWQVGRVATPVLTVVTLAAGGVTRDHLETVLDAALTSRLVTVDRISALLAKPGWLRFPGRPMLMLLLDERARRVGGTALFRSRTEAKVHRWIAGSSLPSGVANLVVSTAIGDVEVDVGWEAARVALEISPFWHHGSRAKQERDLDRRQALLAAGWRIVEADDRHLKDKRTFQTVISRMIDLLIV